MKKFIRISIISLVLIMVICLGGVGWYMFAENSPLNKFEQGTTINNIDVSGLNKNQAQNLVYAKLTSDRNNLDITLNYKDKKWNYKGSDFEIDNQIKPYVNNMFDYFSETNNIRKISKINKNIQIPYSTILTGLEQKIDEIATQINVTPIDSEVIFDQTKSQSFFATQEINGISVNKNELLERIDNGLYSSTIVNIDIPILEIIPNITKKYLEQFLSKRSSFSTNYSNSNADRKHNIRQALSRFNGLKIEPGEEVSFNEKTGSRNETNGYKQANIILGGVYTLGTGGGVCQASTTLYNSLLLADIDVLEVNKHSLPASYVWLGFDAMVSEGYSDLKFKNNTTKPIYIKTWGDEKNCYAEVYGEPLGENVKIERKAEFVRAIPHNGDRIVKDSNREYIQKVTFKGEYYRLKYPQEGYECKAYIIKNDNGNITEKLIRHDIYQPQEGVIIEGVEDLSEGLTLPKNNVNIIPPQQNSKTSKENVLKKIENQNPSEYNP